MTENKSILDHVQVKEDTTFQGLFNKGQSLGIVGHCATCGNPIYGSSVAFKDKVPPVQRSCDCKTSVMEHQTK